MNKAYKVIGLTIFIVFMFSSILQAERRVRIEQREQFPGTEFERVESAAQIKMMRKRLVDLRQAALNAEREGRPEEARELREKIAGLVEQIQMRTQRTAQRRLREVDEHLERLRQMIREAEEIRETIRSNIEKREMIRPEPEQEMPLRPRAQKRFENVHNLIGQIRETFNRQLDRIEELIGGFRNNMIQMERELRELRAENEGLRNQLRERAEQRRPRDRDVPPRRDAERPRDEGEYIIP
jgi:chromosome segregation ATPase